MTPREEVRTTVRRIEIGDRLYLFTCEDARGHRPSRLILSSHGGFHERAVADRASKGWLTVPRWTTLFFYADHGLALYDPGTKNVLGYRPAQEQAPATPVQNYVLSKFQEGGGGNESYASITSGIDRSHELLQQQKEALARYGLDLDAEADTDPAETERRLAAIEADVSAEERPFLKGYKGKRQVELYDVLTVRNRRLRRDMTLRDLLHELETAGHLYEEIHCSFCRCPILPARRESEIRSMDAQEETRWARTGNFVRKPR